jgi:hypothetical protein
MRKGIDFQPSVSVGFWEIAVDMPGQHATTDALLDKVNIKDTGHEQSHFIAE